MGALAAPHESADGPFCQFAAAQRYGGYRGTRTVGGCGLNRRS
jgi:hypothetical protein